MWSMQNGKFVYQDVPRHSRTMDHYVAASVVSGHTHESHVHAVAGGSTTSDTGTFVDSDGLPANGSPVAGIAQAGQIVSSGVVDAYVLDVAPRAKLS